MSLVCSKWNLSSEDLKDQRIFCNQSNIFCFVVQFLIYHKNFNEEHQKKSTLKIELELFLLWLLSPCDQICFVRWSSFLAFPHILIIRAVTPSHAESTIPLAKFSGWSGLQNWSGNFVKIALEQRNWCKVDPNTSPLPTEASRQYLQWINDPKRDEWFYLKSIFLKVFLCEMGNTVRCWPRYWPDRPHRGRGGARLAKAALVSSAEATLSISDQDHKV